MKKINILQLITGLGVGGAEKVVLELVKNSNNDTFNHHVIGLSKSAALNFKFKEAGIETIILNKDKSLSDFLDMISYVNSFVKENKIDIIHAHMTHAMFVAAAVKLVNPHIKIVFTSHNVNVGSKLREFIIFLLKPFRNADIVFSRDQLDPKYISNYFVIPNGIDLGAYKQNIEKFNKFTFLAVGSLGEQKNHMHLIKCARSLKSNYEFQILIAGDGPLRDELEKQIELYVLQDHVKLLGLRSDIPELLNKAHCFVMPSLWEGMPIAILEAGASNLPVISTPVGTIPSLIDDTNGYLPVEDDFCKVMEYVVNNYEEATIKATVLYQKAIEEYSIKNVVNEHEKLYSSLLGKWHKDNSLACIQKKND